MRRATEDYQTDIHNVLNALADCPRSFVRSHIFMLTTSLVTFLLSERVVPTPLVPNVAVSVTPKVYGLSVIVCGFS